MSRITGYSRVVLLWYFAYRGWAAVMGGTPAGEQAYKRDRRDSSENRGRGGEIGIRTLEAA